MKSLRMFSGTPYFQARSFRRRIVSLAHDSNNIPADGPLWVANKNQLRPYVSTQYKFW